MAEGSKTQLANKSDNAGQNKKGSTLWLLRAALTLTDAYVATSHMPCDGAHTVGLFVAFSAAIDYTSVQAIAQGSYDGTTWFDLPQEDGTYAKSVTIANTGVGAAAAGGFLVIARVHAGVRFVRAAIKRTGGTAVGTVAVEGIEGLHA